MVDVDTSGGMSFSPAGATMLSNGGVIGQFDPEYFRHLYKAAGYRPLQVQSAGLCVLDTSLHLSTGM